MQPEEATRLVNSLFDVLKPPFQVVQLVVDNKWTFAINHFPTELQSDEEPPVRLSERAELIPIDGLLGKYDADRQEITIFKRGIAQVAKQLNLRDGDVTFVVRLHEWAHALLHVGLVEAQRLRVTKDETSWSTAFVSATTEFRRLNGVHEQLAQLIVHHGLQSLRSTPVNPEAKSALDRIAEAFENLMRRAPAEYRIEKYASVSRNKVVTSIGLVKDGGLTGFAAWDKVITW